jgi:translation initiation factor 3 subunit C
MHRTEPTRLQSLALQLAEKMASLVDQNERMLEMKTTGPGYFNYQRQGNCFHKLSKSDTTTELVET